MKDTKTEILKSFGGKFKSLHIMKNGTVDTEYIDLRLFLLVSLDQVREQTLTEVEGILQKDWEQKLLDKKGKPVPHQFALGYKMALRITALALTKLKGEKKDE